MVCLRHPFDPQDFPVFASEVGPPDPNQVAFGVVPCVAVVEVDVLHIITEPAARAVFVFVNKRNPEFGYIHFQSSLNHYTTEKKASVQSRSPCPA